MFEKFELLAGRIGALEIENQQPVWNWNISIWLK